MQRNLCARKCNWIFVFSKWKRTEIIHEFVEIKWIFDNFIAFMIHNNWNYVRNMMIWTIFVILNDCLQQQIGHSKFSTLKRWSQLHGNCLWAYVDQFSHSLAILCMCRYVLKLAAPLLYRWNLSVALSWPALTHKRRPDITNRQTRQSYTICTHCKYIQKKETERERFS